MDRDAMLERTKAFALRIVRLAAALPRDRAGDVLGRQLLKSGTSVGANYRKAVRASSRKQFVSSLEVVQREADETLYGLDLVTDAGMVPADRVSGIKTECGELLAIITATIRTAKRGLASAQSAISHQKSETHS